MEPAEPSSEQHGAAVGSVLLGVGGLGLLLLILAAGNSLPGRLQSQVHGNAPVWTLVSCGLIAAGIRFLWYTAHGPTGWTPTLPGQRFRTVVVYSRPDCPLCEEGLEVLSHYRPWLPAAVEVNIEDDPALQLRFGESIPVVEIDGRIRFRGCVNERLLRRLIEGTAPLPVLRRR
ncbi:glutaredoxin family protein [Planctomicrobium piriforme]|uniref:Glutaredoxin n=1 Tax=Planctomicrobium piriforme TaxID=1576369 RepID=A0A1I3DIM0_9PLAN|nr:glutaredoxin family protein [Planctomicrobium piriforme]SFH86429.1 Glutaredoxin [Planctomicrobium piriforme]